MVKCMFALALLSGCRGEKKKNLVINQIPKAAVEVDSTVYGVCGLGTAMNTLELITKMAIQSLASCRQPTAKEMSSEDCLSVTGWLLSV